MNRSGNSAENWNSVAKKWFRRSSEEELLAEHKRKTHLALVARWADLSSGCRVLKTDLFEEASGSDQFLFDLARVNSGVIGMDISHEVICQARKQAKGYGVDASGFLCCDVKHLPFKENSLDLIISDSTLDHFPCEEDIVVALKELCQVLKAGGILILTLDNKRNLTYPPYMVVRLWMKLGLAPYFIGKTIPLAKLKRVLEGIGFEVVKSTAIFHYPHPDALVRWGERFLRKLSGGKLDNAIRRGLTLLDRLEGKRTKYLTGRYIAVKAVKRKAA